MIPSSRLQLRDINIKETGENRIEILLDAAYPANPQLNSSHRNIFLEDDDQLFSGKLTFDEGQLLSYRLRDYETPPFLPAPIREGWASVIIRYQDGRSEEFLSQQIRFGQEIVESKPESPLPLPDQGIETEKERKELESLLAAGEKLPSYIRHTSQFRFEIELNEEDFNDIREIFIPQAAISDQFGNYSGISWTAMVE